MECRSAAGVMSDDDDEQQSPTPHGSFTLLEARDSHADDIAVDGAIAAPRSRASSAYTPETHRHPFQFHSQHAYSNTTSGAITNQQRRPAAAAATVSATPTRQPAPPNLESYYEYSGRVAAPSPRAAAQGNNSFLQRQQQQQRIAQSNSLHDLFPLINSSVFTNPDNIMPSLQDAIMIDDGHDSLASFASTVNGGGSNTLNATSLAANQLSLNAIFGTRIGAAPSIGRGAATASARDPSCQSFVDLGLRSSTSGDSLSDTLRSNASFARRTSPKQWVRSLVRRFHTNWDSYFLLFTLVLSIAAVPVAIAIAAVLEARVSLDYHARCQLPLARGETRFRVSTASIASILIPALNHVVLFVVSSWIAIRCSRSRKRVLRSHGQQSARMNLTSAFMLPCYEAIWYMIAILSLTGIVIYTVSYQQVDAPSTDDGSNSDNSTSERAVRDAQYPCTATSLPLVWILQLLPMLMTQRSVSQEAVVRSIVYSGAACIVMLVLIMSLYRQGSNTVTAVSIAVHALLCAFYFWAKFVFHARSTFDFFFVSAVVGVVASVVVQTMDVAGKTGTHAVFVGECVVNSLFALTTVALLLSLRADTRYWLGIDDASAPTRNPMRQYMRQLSERGMITNFSTRTSVYDVHRMIEEHRKNVVDFSALKLDGIIAQGATSIVMRGVLRGTTDIALKIYTSVQVTDEELHRFSRETALNVQLSHPNVVRFYGLCVVPPSISLVFEFCEYGGLDVALQSSSLWGLSTKLKAWLDACKAVAYLHSFSPPLLHRDIKTDNFLLGQDYLLKLADFGEANLLRPRTDGTMTIAGTVDYMAPEMILGGKTARYGTAVDTYSLMITLWQIMVPDRSPWHGKTHLEVYTCVKDGERPPLLPSIPQGCAEILESGWAANPVDRVAVADLIPKVHKLWLLSLHQKMLKRTK